MNLHHYNRVIETQLIDEIAGEDIDEDLVKGDGSDINKIAKELELKDAFGGDRRRFCNFKSTVPFYYNANTYILVAPGVEIESVLAFPIPRKMPNTLNLDSYEFVANEDNNAINECDKKQIIEYLEVL